MHSARIASGLISGFISGLGRALGGLWVIATVWGCDGAPALGPASAQSMPRPLPSQVSGPLALTPLPTPYGMTPPGVQAATPAVGTLPAAAPARKPWLLLGGLGAVAVAAVSRTVMTLR